MAGKDRKRQIARQRYERRQAQRMVARQKARQRLAVGSAAGAVIVIVAIVLAVVLSGGGKSPAALSAGASGTASASVSVPPAPTYAAGCTTKLSASPTASATPWAIPSGADSALKTEPTVTIPAGTVPITLQTKDLIVGTGETATADDSVTVNYVGVNYVDCTEFDSSWSRGDPATFSLSGVISGFAQGVEGMKVGGRREIIIPPSLGYGSQSAGTISANEELVFVVDLLGVTKGSASPSAAPASPSAAPASSSAAPASPTAS